MMHFRSHYEVREILIRTATEDGALAAYEDSYLEIQLGGPHNVAVTVRNNTQGKAEEGYKTRLCCDVNSRFHPKPKIHSMFESLVEKRLPSNSSIPPENREAYIDDSGVLKEIPPLRFLPANLQDFVGQVGKEHKAAGQRTVDAIRWRGARLGPHNPISQSHFSWSLDNKSWHSFPTPIQATLELHSYTVHISDQAQAEIKSLVVQKANEPLGHELLREAWAQCGGPNLRSALVIGVAALEVGLKDFVSALVPQAEWLVLEVPTPPVVRMLREYLPSLPTKCDFQGKVLPPPKETLDTIEEAIRDRNTVSHRGRTKPLNPDELKERLWAIRDVLWLLDYYRGHEWALEYVREETKAAMSEQQ